MSTANRVSCQVNFTSNEIGVQFVSSRLVADMFGRRHADVLRQIDSLQLSGKLLNAQSALSEYKDSTGRTLPQMLLTESGFSVLVASFNLESEEDKNLQKAIFQQFNNAYIELLNQNKLLKEKLAIKLNKVGDTTKYINEPIEQEDLFGSTITTHHKRVERNSKERLELLDLELYWLYKQRDGVDKSIIIKIKEIEDEKLRLLESI